MKFALLTDAEINGRSFKAVASIADEASPGAVQCPDNIEIGDVYHGGGFLARACVERGKPERTLDDAKAEKLGEIEAHAKALRYAVAGTDDASKLAVYQTKYETAQAALGGNQAALDALAPEAAARGETAGELAALVKSLGDQWRAAGLAIDAAYQTHKAAVLTLETIEAVDAYDAAANWPF